MPRTLAALAALTLAACNPTSEEACLEAAAVDGTLAVGVGEQTFAAVADGDTVPLVLGSQGGLMVLGALRVTGIVQGADGVGSCVDMPTSTEYADPSVADRAG